MAGTDAGQAGQSIVTLDLPKAPLTSLANVADLYQSIFGITPDVSCARAGICNLTPQIDPPPSHPPTHQFSNVNDTTSFYQRAQDIILSSAP